MAFFPGHGRLFYPAAPFYPSVYQKQHPYEEPEPQSSR